MSDDTRLELARQESARQNEAISRAKDRFCPQCSSPSPFGGDCASCMANSRPTETTPAVPAGGGVCPSCSGPSAGGFSCPACRAATQDDDRRGSGPGGESADSPDPAGPPEPNRYVEFSYLPPADDRSDPLAPRNERYLVLDYEAAGIIDRRGDGLDGHEVINHAYLQEHGIVEKERASFNTAILLTPEEHRRVSSLQHDCGLQDRAMLAALSLSDVLDLNEYCLRAAGIPAEKIDEVMEYAWEHVPSLLDGGLRY